MKRKHFQCIHKRTYTLTRNEYQRLNEHATTFFSKNMKMLKEYFKFNLLITI